MHGAETGALQGLAGFAAHGLRVHVGDTCSALGGIRAAGSLALSPIRSRA